MQYHNTHPSLTGAATAFRNLANALTDTAPNLTRVTRSREDVRRLLATETEIRVFIDGTKNLGHQAASLDLLKRILDLTGFCGDVLVFYADYGRAHLGVTAEKIAFLLPQAAGAPLEAASILYLSGAQIRFVPYELRAELPRRARFGFGGGADDMGVNYAAELGVDWFLRLQPFLWDDEARQKSDLYYESSRIEAADGRRLYLVDAWPPLRELPLKRPRALPSLAARADAAGTDVIAELEHFGFAIWPIYGLHHFHELTPVIVFNLIGAALFLSARAGKPIALLSFCPLAEDLCISPLLAALARRICTATSSAETEADFDGLRLPAAFAAMLDAIPRPARLDFVRCGSAPPNIRISPDRPDGAEAVLFQLGPAAPAAFEQVLRSASLPPVIEGQGTANLLLNLGRPYLHLLRPEHVIKNPYVSGVAVPGREALAAQINAIVQRLVQPLESAPPNRVTAAEDVARLVLRLTEPSSEEAQYFASFPHWLSADEHDKLFLGLAALRCAVQVG